MLPEIPGFRNLEALGSGANGFVYRAVERTGDADRRVALKHFLARECTPAEIDGTRRLIARWRELAHPHMIVPERLIQVGDSWCAVQQLAPAGDLTQRLKRHPGGLSLEAFFQLATAITSAVGALHDHGLLHLNLKPSNVLFGVGDQVWVSDPLSPLTRRAGSGQASLAWCAPEQTGLLQRPLDARTDVYSLGTLFFAALCGVPPFADDDDLALLHQHVAAAPPLASELRPDLPDGVVALLGSMLAKSPTDRPLTAGALVEDLAQLRANPDRVLTPARLRRHSFRLSDRLFGREVELQRLRHTVSDASSARIVILSGDAGVGKSRLAAELLADEATGGSFVASHAYARLVRPTPFEALEAIARRLVESARRDASHGELVRDRIHKRLRGREALLLRWLPELGPLLGRPDTELDELPPAAARNRFVEVMADWLMALGTPEQPVVLFLDDVHRADASTLAVLKVLAERSPRPDERVVVVATWRPDKVDRSHPLEVLRRTQSPGIHWQRIGPLSSEGVAAWVEDSVDLPDADASQLADHLHRLSSGNPLVLRELLLAMVEGGALADRDGAWRWDPKRAGRMELSRDATSLLVARLRRLAPEARRILGHAAVLGVIEPSDLATRVPGATVDTAWAAIEEAQSLGLLQLLGGRLRFVHERVSEALADGLAQQERLQAHQVAARALHGVVRPGESGHYMLASHLLVAPDALGRETEALVLTHAGRSATDALAFAEAEQYLEAAEELVPAEDHELRREVLELLGLVRCTGDYSAKQEGIRDLRQALSLSRDPSARARLLTSIHEAWWELGETEKALEAGQEALVGLGLWLPRSRRMMAFAARINLARFLITGMRVRHPATGPELARLRALSRTWTALSVGFFFLDRTLHLFVGSQLFLLSRRIAELPDRLAQIDAAAVLSVLGRHAEARRLAQAFTGVDIPARARFKLISAGPAFWGAGLGTLGPTVTAAREALPQMIEARFHYRAVTTALILVSGAGETGDTAAVLEGIELGKLAAERGSVGTARVVMQAMEHDADCLIRARLTPSELRAWHHDRTARREESSNALDLASAIAYGVRSLFALGDWRGAARLTDDLLEAGIHGDNRTPLALITLPCAAVATGHSLRQARERGRSSWRQVLRFRRIRRLARRTTRDVAAAAPYLLILDSVEAELRGDRSAAWLALEAAHRRAETIDQHRTAALARLLLADLLFRHDSTLAKSSATGAVAYCRRLGWVGLADAWASRFGLLAGVEDEGAGRLVERRITELVVHLNRATTLPDLLERVLAVLLQTTGAESGLLAVPGEQDFQVIVRKGAGALHLPAELLDRASQEQGPLVVSDLRQAPELARDKSLEGVRSLMVVPIRLGGELSAVVYLESRSLEGVFGTAQLGTAEALGSAAAVAIENTVLRSELEGKVEERTRELESSNADLTRALRLNDEFLANMSHELRTPLNAVLGLSEAVLEGVYGPLTHKQRRSLETVQSSGKHLLSLINDILDLAKIKAGKLELHEEVLVVASVCHTSLQFVRSQARKKKQEVELEVHPEVDRVRADERYLKQILINLLSNAVKFTPEGGKLGLEVGVAGNGVRFTVWDEGIGIAPEDRDSLFKPFQQLDSGLAREHAGTGLGLSLVKQLVDLHDGQIALSSSPGAGTRFSVTLPHGIRTEELGEVDDITELAPVEVSGRHVLVADDNADNLQTVGDYLQARGYRVSVARGGDDVLQRVAAEAPDVILMDIQMPGMDGLEATRRLRADRAREPIPIIAMSALAQEGDRERCLEAGCDAWLPKPVELARLVRLIESQPTGHSRRLPWPK